ncbi:MAG: IspD/TarI family cytidylyltransferase [Phycisphaerae bacterium]
MAKMAVLFVMTAPPWAANDSGRPFMKIDNREVFMRTIEIYANRDQVEQRLLCLLPDELSRVQQKYGAHLGFQGVSVATGGPNWFGAVARGLEKLKPEIDLVMVHDASCPVVPYTLLDAMEQAITNAPAVAPVLALGNALVRVKGGALDAGFDAAGLQQLQSPQLFQRSALEQAYAQRSTLRGGASRSGPVFDDATLLRAAGKKVTVVAGSPFNVRAESEETLRVVSDMVKHLPKPRSKAPLTPFDEAQW